MSAARVRKTKKTYFIGATTSTTCLSPDSRDSMGRKGKAQKHTAAEIAGKHAAAKAKKGGVGGGKAAKEMRATRGAGCAIACPTCATVMPNAKSMKLHCENKHPKMEYDDEKWNAQFAAKRGDFLTTNAPKAKPKPSKKKASVLDREGKKDGGFSLF